MNMHVVCSNTDRFEGEVPKPWTPASWRLSQQLPIAKKPTHLPGWINGWHGLSQITWWSWRVENFSVSCFCWHCAPCIALGQPKKIHITHHCLSPWSFSHVFNRSKLRNGPRTPRTFWTQGSYWVCILPSEVPGASTLVYCLKALHDWSFCVGKTQQFPHVSIWVLDDCHPWDPRHPEWSTSIFVFLKHLLYLSCCFDWSKNTVE